jgi:hypothetical protein
VPPDGDWPELFATVAAVVRSILVYLLFLQRICLRLLVARDSQQNSCHGSKIA